MPLTSCRCDSSLSFFIIFIWLNIIFILTHSTNHFQTPLSLTFPHSLSILSFLPSTQQDPSLFTIFFPFSRTLTQTYSYPPVISNTPHKFPLPTNKGIGLNLISEFPLNSANEATKRQFLVFPRFWLSRWNIIPNRLDDRTPIIWIMAESAAFEKDCWVSSGVIPIYFAAKIFPRKAAIFWDFSCPSLFVFILDCPYISILWLFSFLHYQKKYYLQKQQSCTFTISSSLLSALWTPLSLHLTTLSLLSLDSTLHPRLYMEHHLYYSHILLLSLSYLTRPIDMGILSPGWFSKSTRSFSSGWSMTGWETMLTKIF